MPKDRSDLEINKFKESVDSPGEQAVKVVNPDGSTIAGSSGGGTEYTDAAAAPTHPKGGTVTFNKAGVMTAVSDTEPLPVDATVTATIDTTGLASDSNQTNGSQKTQLVDAGGEAVTITGGKLDVNASVDTTGLATSAKQDTLDASINTLLKPASTLAAVTSITNVVHVDDNAGSLTVDGSITANAGTNLNTSALALESGGNIAAIKAKTDNIPAQGQALAAASLPVVLPATQITTLTPPAAITGFATSAKQDTIIGHVDGIEGYVDGIEGLLTTVDADTSNISTKIDSIAAEDFATQTTLAAINSKMITGTDIGDVTINNASGASAVNIQDGGNTITVDGTITANLSATDNTAIDLIASNQTDHSQVTQIVDSAGNAVTVTGNKLDVNATASLSGDAIPVSGASTAVSVAIVDGSGNQITSFGGGTQYSDADANADPTGTVAMGTDGTNIFALHTDTTGDLQVDVLTLPTATVQATNLDIRDLSSASDGVAIYGSDDGGTTKRIIKTDSGGAIQIDLEVASVTANAGTNLNTSALALESGGNIAAIKAKTDNIPALGQALAAASVPVILPAATITTLTPPAAITGFATSAKQDTVIGHVDGIETLLGTIDADTSNLSTKIDTLAGAVTGTEMQVDVLTMPTTTVQATNLDVRDLTSASDSVEAKQATGSNLHTVVDSGTITSITNAVAVTGTFYQATQPVSLVSVPSHAVTNAGTFATQVSSIAAGDNNIGNVDIASALPAGTNAIGKLAANSGVDIGDVDVTSLPAIPAGTNAIGKLLPPDIDVTAHTNYARKYYTSAGAATDGIIWSPAAGKRWHITSLIFQTSADATITFEDDKAGGDDPVLKGEFKAGSGMALTFDEKYPMASGEDAADLTVTTTAGNIYITVCGYEI